MLSHLRKTNPLSVTLSLVVLVLIAAMGRATSDSAVVNHQNGGSSLAGSAGPATLPGASDAGGYKPISEQNGQSPSELAVRGRSESETFAEAALQERLLGYTDGSNRVRSDLLQKSL